jgi:anhydro-N-acetylmuramic acid kinase
MTGPRPGDDAPITALGLMSGTSMDGIDAAIVTSDGRRIFGFGPVATYPYDAALRDRLRDLLGREPGTADADVIRRPTLLHAEAVRRLLAANTISPGAIDVIGFHGHTVLHRPELKLTLQIGDGQMLADETGIAVVEDFRSDDVAAGGHGAPLAPLFHAALARDVAKPVAVLNIGGVANVTWIGSAIGSGAEGGERIVAFDTGPGNALIDDWVKAASGQGWDEGGRLARGGRIHDDLIAAWLQDEYFRALPPKSLDRNRFASILADMRDLTVEDGAATLTAFTVRCVAAAERFMPAPPRRWLICGGGRCNETMMAMLAHALPAPVEPVEAVGWNGDALEAEAFAFLAVRSLRALPLSLPSTTGVPSPLTGGILRRPRPAPV